MNYNQFLKMNSLLKIAVVLLALICKISGGCVGNQYIDCGTKQLYAYNSFDCVNCINDTYCLTCTNSSSCGTV